MYTVQAFGSSAGATCRLIMRGVATQEKYPVQLIIAEDTVSCGLTTLRLLTIAGLCSSPFAEDVPPRRDRSIHGVPPSVTGLVHSRSVPLHPTSVNGLVHSPSVHSVNTLHTCPRMYAHSAGHIQLNLINAIAVTPEQLRAFSPHRETRPYFESC